MSRTFVFRQLGVPTLSVWTIPPDLTNIPADPTGGTGTITATITLEGDATGWTATKNGDPTDAFITDFTSSGDRINNTLTITYNRNTGVDRRATLTITTTGGTGVYREDLVITQDGPPSLITTNPPDLMRLPAAGYVYGGYNAGRPRY